MAKGGKQEDDLMRRQAAMLDAALDAVVSVDLAGRILEFNGAAERMFGSPASDVVGRRFGELFVPAQELPARTENFRRLFDMEDGESTAAPVELTLVHRNGSPLRVETTAARTTVNGEPALIAFFHDVAAESAAKELAFSAPRLPLSELLPIVTYTNLLWPVAATVWMSPQAERITGYPVADWVGNPGFFESVIHPADRKAVLDEAYASRRKKRAFSADYRILRPDGRVMWIHDESVPIDDAHGRHELLQGYFVDVTARKELEQQLLHSQKTEELGRLAGQIAHDFNNLLVAIRLDAELLGRRLPDDALEQEYVNEMIDTAERARQLTHQLLAFARRQQFEPRDIVLQDVVEGLVSVLRRVAGEAVEFDFELEPTPLVYADIGRLEQVLVNLVANARDAMADGGLISIGTHSTTLRADRADRLGVPIGDYAVMAVSDTGAGMDEETKASVFEPFFTTKTDDRGTGLGLAIVDSVVRQAGGVVELESSPGNGARFRIYLPAISG